MKLIGNVQLDSVTETFALRSHNFSLLLDQAAIQGVLVPLNITVVLKPFFMLVVCL